MEIIEHLKDIQTKENQELLLTCVVSKPNQRPRWTKNGKDVKKDDRYVVKSDGQTHTLTIKDTNMTDHHAKIEISFDKLTSNAQIFVEGKNIKIAWS